MIQFYGYFRSSASYRCRIAFNLKDMDYEFTSIHLRRNGGEHKTAEYLDANPQGLVPTLIDDEVTIGQSLAIIEWLDEKYPEPALLPSDINDKARVRAFAQIIACDIHPLQNLRVLQYLKNTYDADQDALDAWCQAWLGDGLAACEALVARADHGGAYCFGDTPGLADICLVPQIASAHRFKVDLSGMPNLVRIHNACQQLPAFAAAAPDQQPDAEA